MGSWSHGCPDTLWIPSASNSSSLAWLLSLNQPESWETDKGAPLKADSSMCMCVLLRLWWQLVYPGDLIDMSTTAGQSKWAGDNYLLLTDEVTEVLWGYVPVPPLCGARFLPLILRSFSALTIDAFIICPSLQNYLEARSKLRKKSWVSWIRNPFNANCISFVV